MAFAGLITIQGDVAADKSVEDVVQQAQQAMGESGQRLANLAKKLGVKGLKYAPYPGIFVSLDHEIGYDLVEFIDLLVTHLEYVAKDTDQK